MITKMAELQCLSLYLLIFTLNIGIKIMKTLIKTGLVAPFILATGMANAALVQNFGDVTTIGFDYVQSYNNPPTATFDDQYEFQLSSLVNMDGLLGNILQTVGQVDELRIDNMVVDFYADNAGSWVLADSWNVAAGQDLIYHEVLGAGSYFINIAGDVTGEIGGTYDLTGVTSAVPEPSTYALMLGGLGLVGFMTARRRKENLA